MKILHVTNTLEQGGVESFLLDLLPAIKKRGHVVSVMVMDRKKNKLHSLFEEKGIQVYTAPFNSLYNIFNLFFLWKLSKNYQVIHSHLFPCQYYVAWISFLGRKRKVFVTTEHSISNRRRNRSFFRIIEKFMYSRYNKIITISDLATRNLSSWINKNCITIYNGIHLNKSQQSSARRENFGISALQKLVIMVARFYEAKDHATAIKAMTLLPKNVVLAFIGSGETMEACKSLVSDLSLNNRVLFWGQQNNIASLLNMADICLLATCYEGFPISVLEYMAASKPIVASNVPGVSNLVKDIGLLYQHKNEQDLANKISEILNSSELSSELSQKAYTKVLDFSIEKTTDNYLRVYYN